ncbi:Gas vesicle synthesis GvpLGvpF [Psychromonas ingrahamii 37]|uniref:Gas vesicle synthesis GvpLGvpF n=1 Tax=Psychromonas ingrahamii (strain DSM 17664 / CCUG 51855 / 37) TaxID=357804 RepID=A1SUB4_PSYIN|nr:GvpL/GvpF family gas vesicle protein [Psychromonas ingrahamii]ABM03079.1 Gas vesicle synthesis GvpLGvpF [Psychromonas ingrahamii 37]
MSYLIYCVLATPIDDEIALPIKVNEQPVLWVSERGLSIALSPNSEISSGQVTVDEQLRYGKLVETLHHDYDLIPMQYGSRFEKLSDVTLHLQEHYKHYLQLLEQVKGCVEMSIRMLLPDSAALITDSDDGASKASKEIESRSGLSYLQSRRIHYTAEGDSRSSQDSFKLIIDSKLAQLYISYRSDTGILAERQVHSRHYLVRREKVEAFTKALHEVMELDIGYLFLSGPWPPYHFVHKEKSSMDMLLEDIL